MRERERERERELTASGQWSSLISSFFWHPVVGFAMLNFKTNKNITFMLDVREWGRVEQMKMTQRGSEACAFFRVLLVSFFFFGFGFFPKRMGPRPKP